MQAEARGVKRVKLLVEHLDHRILALAELRLLLERAAHRLHADLALAHLRVREYKRVHVLPSEHNDLTSVLVRAESADRLLLAEALVLHFQ